MYNNYLSSPQIFRGFRVTRSSVLYVMFCRSLFVLLFFFFWSLYCLSICGFWLPLIYLQTLLST